MEAKDFAEAQKAMYPIDLMEGLGSKKDAYTAMRKWLKEIEEDDRTHAEIAKDTSFHIRRMEPLLFMVALIRYCLVNGMDVEGLQTALDCNIAWLENHGTKLTHKSSVGHAISPNQAAFVGGDPLSKKTCTVRRSDDFSLTASSRRQRFATGNASW